MLFEVKMLVVIEQLQKKSMKLLQKLSRTDRPTRE